MAMTKTSSYRTFSLEGHELEDALASFPGRPYDWADELIAKASKGERREAIERVWQLFGHHTEYEQPTISPKELYEALEAVLNEEQDA